MTTSDDGQPDKRIVLGREAKPVRKRFYHSVTAAETADGYSILLDGRPVRTPRKFILAVPSRALAEAMAAEWQSQTVEIVPASMPLTTLACTALDAVREQMTAVADEIARYAASDLLCYRAADQPALHAEQAAAWDPIVAWSESLLGVSFKITDGLMPVDQAPAVTTAMQAELGELDHWRLAAVHVLTSLTGSALLALAVLKERLPLDAAWTFGQLDEDWQSARWGSDAEAEARRAKRYRDAVAASTVIACLSTAGGTA